MSSGDSPTDIRALFRPDPVSGATFCAESSNQDQPSWIGTATDGTNSVQSICARFDFRPRLQLRLGGDHDRCSAQ